MFQRILVPVALSDDGPALAERSVELARELVNRGGHIRLLAVLPPARRSFDQTGARDDAHERDAVVLGADRQLRELAAKFDGVTFETHTNASDDVARAIMDEGAKVADAIVIASHSRTGVANAILGSVATDVARHAAIPVVVFAGSDR